MYKCQIVEKEKNGHYPFCISNLELPFVQCVCNLIMGIGTVSRLTSLKNKQRGLLVFQTEKEWWGLYGPKEADSQINTNSNDIMKASGIEDRQWARCWWLEETFRASWGWRQSRECSLWKWENKREVTASMHVRVYWLCQQSCHGFETDWLLGVESSDEVQRTNVYASFCTFCQPRENI